MNRRTKQTKKMMADPLTTGAGYHIQMPFVTGSTVLKEKGRRRKRRNEMKKKRKGEDERGADEENVRYQK
jgi:hypothetical protein